MSDYVCVCVLVSAYYLHLMNYDLFFCSIKQAIFSLTWFERGAGQSYL